MSELGTSISCLRADHAEMSSFWLALFTLLDYFIRQMFHKPDLNKISNFLWSTFSVEQIVFSQRKGHRTAVPFSVIFLALFFFLLQADLTPLFFSPHLLSPSALQSRHKHLSALSLRCLSLYVYSGKCLGYFKVRLTRIIFTEQCRRALLHVITFV